MTGLVDAVLAALDAQPWQTSTEVARAIGRDPRACAAILGQIYSQASRRVRRRRHDGYTRRRVWLYAPGGGA